MEFKMIVKELQRLITLYRYSIYHGSAECGLYIGQLPILEAINENELCTQKRLSEIINVSPPSVATSIKRMQKAGFVQKIKDKDDKRNNLLQLTDAGKQILLECRKSYDAVNKSMFDGFAEDEIEAFYGYIQRLSKNLLNGDESVTDISSVSEQDIIW